MRDLKLDLLFNLGQHPVTLRHNKAIHNSVFPRAIESKASSKKSLRARNGVLPNSVEAVYSFKVIVPVVQRTEQGFPNAKTAFLLESPNEIRSIQLPVLEVVD